MDSLAWTPAAEPLVPACLSVDAHCHPAFSAATSWAVHILPPRHRDLALWFASKGVDKFSRDEATESAVYDEEPTVYFRRAFHTLKPLPGTVPSL